MEKNHAGYCSFSLFIHNRTLPQFHFCKRFLKFAFGENQVLSAAYIPISLFNAEKAGDAGCTCSQWKFILKHFAS